VSAERMMGCPSLVHLSHRCRSRVNGCLRPAANPKIGELVDARQLPAERSGAGTWLCRSAGGLEGDFVTEGFELADVAVLAAFGVDAGGVEP
jgi:hypothetical protein